MNIQSLQAQQLSDVSRTSSLRSAAEVVAPPKLSDDEVNMISKQFPAGKTMTWYTNNGSKHEEQMAVRGSRIDIKV
ncbi:MAG: hypothetical protein JJU41_09940 [Bacteroidetes bacterium]|nr:hypothetical protein [Bacteroidota bacterium]MCH8523837.1 hypothetical protein [Balneolales bacterium]